MNGSARMHGGVSYAGDKNRQLTRYSDTRWHEDSVRNRWFSVMAGPSVRVNELFSAYAMAGVSYSRVSTFSGDYLQVTDNKGTTFSGDYLRVTDNRGKRMMCDRK